MAEEIKIGCARPTGGLVGETVEDEKKVKDENSIVKEGNMSMIKIGKKTPDFSAPGYHKGKFININLADYLGKWVVLCFYPGDFTFV